jgi:hypothetical protein
MGFVIIIYNLVYVSKVVTIFPALMSFGEEFIELFVCWDIRGVHYN